MTFLSGQCLSQPGPRKENVQSLTPLPPTLRWRLRASPLFLVPELGTIVLCTDSSAALEFVKRKGASRRTRHVDTKIYFMQAWAMEPGQGILKVHGDNQQVADCFTKVTTPRAAHRKALGL